VNIGAFGLAFVPRELLAHEHANALPGVIDGSDEFLPLFVPRRHQFFGALLGAEATDLGTSSGGRIDYFMGVVKLRPEHLREVIHRFVDWECVFFVLGHQAFLYVVGCYSRGSSE